ncbi:MAG: RecX family transcriptional regulator [Bacteroidaceae bacterium]|nr:RecX family transcriptional regulator [Bacteroidaceae bacterium]
MTETEGKTRAEAYCSAAEHCRSEVRAMLERHGAEKPYIESIINNLVKEGFIDESRYARAFVHDKVRFAKWGRVKIAQALWQKRIPQDITDAALESIDYDDYLAALRDVVKAKFRTVKGATEYERKMKTMRSVCSRGYEPALVRKLLDLSDLPD